MFAAIYSFTVKPGSELEFEQSWEELTTLIRDFEGGLGSRLHKNNAGVYIAYAQWPDRETWENSGGNLPASANELRAVMRGACEKIETLHELELITDLLVH